MVTNKSKIKHMRRLFYAPKADELFGGNSYANSAEPGQTKQNAVSDQAVYSLLSQCTFKVSFRRNVAFVYGKLISLP